MESSSLRNVRDVPADERRSLERLLGGSLDEAQQVFIVAYTPGQTRTDAERRSALERLRAVVASAHASLPTDIDTAALDREIDEAVDDVRYGRG